MRKDPFGTLGAAVVLLSSLLTFSCGASPHDRADAVIESAVDRMVRLHHRLEAFISSVEAHAADGCEAAFPVPDSSFYFGRTDPLAERLRSAHGEYRTAVRACGAPLVRIRRQLEVARALRESWNPDGPDGISLVVSMVRRSLAGVDPDVLERALDGAGTDAEAWIALQQVNAPAGMPFEDLERQEASVVELEDRVNRFLDEYDQALSLAIERRDRFYELAGVPVPER